MLIIFDKQSILMKDATFKDRCASINLEHPSKETEEGSHTRVNDDRG